LHLDKSARTESWSLPVTARPFPNPFRRHPFHEMFPKVSAVRPTLEPIETMVKADCSMETSVNCIKLLTSQPNASRVNWLEVWEDHQMELRRKRDECWRFSSNWLYIGFGTMNTFNIRWYETAIASVNRLLCERLFPGSSKVQRQRMRSTRFEKLRAWDTFERIKPESYD
jgi:hypothetical protein